MTSIALFRNLFLTRQALSAKNKGQLMKHLEQHSALPAQTKKDSKVTIHRIKVLKIALTVMTMLRYEFLHADDVQPLDETLRTSIHNIICNLIEM